MIKSIKSLLYILLSWNIIISIITKNVSSPVSWSLSSKQVDYNRRRHHCHFQLLDRPDLNDVGILPINLLLVQYIYLTIWLLKSHCVLVAFTMWWVVATISIWKSHEARRMRGPTLWQNIFYFKRQENYEMTQRLWKAYMEYFMANNCSTEHGGQTHCFVA